MDSASKKTQKGIRNTVIILCAIIAIILGLFINKISKPRVLSADELRSYGVVLFENPRIIAPFSLIDQKGQSVDNKVFEGKWSIVFFGFSHCPDICPMTLSEMTRIYLSLSEEQQANTQLVFVTLDPARDSADLLNTYLAYYDDSIVGLSGDFLEILKFSRNVNIAFTKVPMGDSYTIDHSSNVILINPSAQYQGFIKTPLFKPNMAKSIFEGIRGL